MAYALSQKSKDRLSGVHQDLVSLVYRAIEITEVDFCVLEGVRSAAKQKQLVEAGASKTMNSRHLTGHAVDLGGMVGGSVRWDWNLYHKINAAMQQAAAELKIPLEWGGSWASFPDGPHFQLPWKQYP